MAGFDNQRELNGYKVDGSSLATSRGNGNAATRVNKRRRPSKRVPTTVLEASSTNFRDMVQRLTGVATAPSTTPEPEFARPRPQPTERTTKMVTPSFEDQYGNYDREGYRGHASHYSPDLSEGDYFQQHSWNKNVACEELKDEDDSTLDEISEPTFRDSRFLSYESESSSARYESSEFNCDGDTRQAGAPYDRLAYETSNDYSMSYESQIAQHSSWRDHETWQLA